VNSTDSYELTTYLTYEVGIEVGGEVTVTTRVAISADYMRLTATQTVKNAQGQTVNKVIGAGKQKTLDRPKRGVCSLLRKPWGRELKPAFFVK
jgi:hypothetical protein